MSKVFEVLIKTDNTEAVKEALAEALEKGLEEIGIQAEKYAKLNLEKNPRRINTGLLRNSITHVVETDEKAVYVGTNVEYAPYVHEGTGIYADGGRKTPWSYKDDEGHWHTTHGMKPNRFLKNAAQQHKNEYKDILEAELKA